MKSVHPSLDLFKPSASRRRNGVCVALATIIAVATLTVPAVSYAASLTVISVDPNKGNIRDSSDDLKALDAKLNANFAVAAAASTKVALLATPTLVVPPPVGYRTPTAAELAAAVGALVANVPDGLTISSLVGSAVHFMPASAVLVTTAASTALPGSADVIVEAAAGNNPAASPTIAGAAVKAVATAGSLGKAAEAAAEAVEASSSLAAKITTAAIKGLKLKVPLSPGVVSAKTGEISLEVVKETFDSKAGFLIDEVTKAAVLAAVSVGVDGEVVVGKVIEGIQASGADNKVLNKAVATAAAVLVSTADKATGLIGAAKGAVVSNNPDLTSEQNEAIVTAQQAAIGAAGNAANDARAFGLVNGSASGGTFLTARLSTTQEYADVVTAATIMALPKSAVLALTAALDGYDNTVSGKDIVTAAVFAAQSSAAKFATQAAINFTNAGNNYGLTAADAASSVIAGADQATYGAVVAAVLKAAPLATVPTATAPSVVSAAITAAFAATHTNGKAGLDDIAKAAVAGRKLEAAATVAAAVNAATVTGDTTITALIAAGAMAGDVKNIVNIAAAAAGARGDDSDAAINAAQRTVTATLANKVAFFSTSLDQLIGEAKGNRSADAGIGVLYGSTVINPAGVAAVASAVIAETSASAAAVKAAAIQTNIKLTPGINLAVTVAAAVKADFSQENLQRTVSEQTFYNPALASYVAIGAVAVHPNYANDVAHYALLRAPQASSTVIPAIFAYARLDDASRIASGLAARTDSPSAAAAITSQGFDGILLSGAAEAKQLAYFKTATGAAVKAALALRGLAISQGDGLSTTSGASAPSVGAAGATAGAVSQVTLRGATPENSASNLVLLEVVKAALKSGKLYYKEIIQAAVQTAVSVYDYQNPGSGSSYDITGIIAAAKLVLTDPVKFPASVIDNIGAFAKAEAIAGHDGAGAAGIAYYAHHSPAGNAVTDISGF